MGGVKELILKVKADINSVKSSTAAINKEVSGAVKNMQSKVGKTAQNISNSLKGVSTGMKNMGKSLTTKVTAPIIAGLVGVVKSTEELRGSLARLDTNATQAGKSTKFIRDKLVELSVVSDDTDSNVEALSNLLAVGFSDNGMEKALDTLSGAVIKFPDTLKIEGLADGLQETLATGKAIGPFAEMLERSGMNLDDFNEGLAKSIENGTQENFILKTLADTGLSKVNDAYRKNNEELVKSKEQQMSFQLSMAKLGETLAPIITGVTGIIQKLIDKFNNLSPTGKKVVLIALGIAAAVGPILLVVGSLIGMIANIISIMTVVGPVIAAVAGPVGLAVAAVAALIAIGIALYKNWDVVSAVLKKIFSGLVDMAKMYINMVIGVFKGLITFITGVFTGNWKKAFGGIVSIFKNLWGGIAGIYKIPLNLWITGLNKLIRGMNKVKIDVPDWVPGAGGKSFGVSIPRIPKLANGAVIPPNNEFLAILGDQTSGTNIETPLDTMIQAFKTALGEGNYGKGNNVNVNIGQNGLNMVDEASARRIATELLRYFQSIEGNIANTGFELA